jgi:sortase A
MSPVIDQRGTGKRSSGKSGWGDRFTHFFVPERGPGPMVPAQPERGGRSNRVTRRLTTEKPPPFRPEAVESTKDPTIKERWQALRVQLAVDDAVDEPSERVMLRVALICSTIGLCLLAFLLYAFVFTGLQETRQQRALVNEFQTPQAEKLLTGHVPPEGQPVAVITIPTIGVRQVVVEGSSSADLLRGPGLMIGTAQPGTKGNAVIAGRRTTAGATFAHISTLHPGDSITVVTGLGKFHYRVDQVGTALVGERDPIGPTTSPRLTLVTSNSSFLPSGREYVVAKLVSAPAHAPVPRTAAPATQRALSGDVGSVVPSLLWSLVFGLALAATFVSYRLAPRHIWTVYLLSTPILVALALETFANLFLLLPATL